MVLCTYCTYITTAASGGTSRLLGVEQGGAAARGEDHEGTRAVVADEEEEARGPHQEKLFKEYF